MHLMDHAKFDVKAVCQLESNTAASRGCCFSRQDWKESNISCCYMRYKVAAGVQQVILISESCQHLAKQGMKDSYCPHDCWVNG